MMFVDFKQAFDFIDRAKIYKIFDELKIPKKLTRLVIMTLKSKSINTKNNKKISK